MITLVLGGARSGKSALAERLVAQRALAFAQPVTYIATGIAHDSDMAARIDAHRDRRPSSWRTIEVGEQLSLPAALLTAEGTVLLDALGTWMAAHHGFCVDSSALLNALRSRRGDTIVVSDEVGLGVHPSTEVGRSFRDALGDLNQAVASISDEVLLVVAGRVLPLEGLE
jgi:adenosyl cobinamide kinase/adenosyl cobinamide phosphate guanylyltransferase